MSKDRYDAIVAETRELITQRTRIQFRIGDLALEIEPMRRQGGASGSDAIFGTLVSQVLVRFGEDVGVSASSVNRWRWVASRWPAAHRRDGVPHYIHEILAPIPDERQRFAMLADPPVDQRTGARRWTPDAAKRLMGRQVERPETVQEKVVAVHALVNDEEVASRVAQDLLRRPEVASKAMTDDVARHAVNRAQADHARQGVEIVRQRTPALQHIEHTNEFLDLVGACAQFVASAGRIVPGLRGQNYTDDEQATVQRNLARVRAAADWIEGAVATGQVTPEEGLARLLAGE